eukprot:3937135-Rhodomonas_salina.1
MGDSMHVVSLGATSLPVGIVCGRTISCAIMEDGTVECWGDSAAVAVKDFVTGGVPVLQVAPINTDSGSCALLADGLIKCVNGGYGTPAVAIDLGTSSNIASGIVVIGNPGWCVWFEDGQAKCWGSDMFGELGNGDSSAVNFMPGIDIIDSSVPYMELSDPSWRISAIFPAMDGFMKCGLLESKQIVCWGFLISTSPLLMPEVGDGNVYGAAAGSTYLNLLTLDVFGKVSEFGLNAAAGGTTVGPALVDLGPDPVGQLNCIGCSVCASDEYASSTCRIDSNTECEVCSSECPHAHIQDLVEECSATADLQCEFTCSPNTTNEYVADLSAVKTVSNGGRHICVVLDTGGVKCWGQNTYGQTGVDIAEYVCDSAAEDYGDLPVLNFGLGRTVVQIACGNEHTCALLDDRKLKCWGRGQYGTLGNGALDNTVVGVNLGVLPAVVFDGGSGTGEYALQISCGHFVCCAVLSNNTVACWGSSGIGVLGAGEGITVQSTPKVVDLGTRLVAKQVTVVDSQACVLFAYPVGSIKCWGDYTPYGDTMKRGLASNTMGDALPFVDLGNTVGDGQVVQIDGLSYTSLCAVFETGRAKCWGYGESWLFWGLGKLVEVGDTETGDAIPWLDLGSAAVEGEQDYGLQISSFGGGAGRFHGCAVLLSGEVVCWGENDLYNLGTGDNLDVYGGDQVTPVSGISNAVYVSTGNWFTCAVLDDGAVKCWGSNAYAQLCIGSKSSVADATIYTSHIGGVVAASAKGLQCVECSQCPNTHIIMQPCMQMNDTKCAACPIRHFADTARLACFLCPPGFDCADGAAVPCAMHTFNTGDGEHAMCSPCSTSCATEDEYIFSACNATQDAVCMPCPAGHKCVNYVAIPCPIDTYANDLHDDCLACPEHAHADAASHYIPACICESGYRQCNSTQHHCVLCSEGSFCPGDESAYACSDSHHMTRAGAKSEAECFCQAGYFGTSFSVCTPCPVDHYCPPNSSVAIACPGNASVHVELSDQEADCSCDAGHYNPIPGFVECYACPADMFCPGGNLTVPCPGNTTTAGKIGRTSVHDCVAKPSFYFENGTTTGGAARQCPANYWCPGGLHDKASCPSHSLSLPASSVVEECFCDAYYHGECTDHCEDMCDPCPADHWCPGGTVVSICPNFTSVGVGLGAAVTDCLCNAGYLGGAGGPCSVCPINSYCPGGDMQRISCPLHMGVSAGALSRLQCSCNVGYFGSAGALTGCAECSVDHYCEGAPGDSQAALERPCPAFSTTEGATGVSSIAVCKCNSGFWSDDGNNCLQCPENHFCIGNEGKLACERNSSSLPGSDESSDCSCDPGFTGEDGGTCLQCPANSYCEGSSHIQACAANARALPGSSKAGDCTCNAGYFGVGTVAGGGCTLCRNGYWCPGGAITSPEYSCPQNAITQVGSDSLTDCTCAASFWGAFGRECTLCEANYWCPGGDQNNSCPSNSSSFAASSMQEHCICNPGFKGPDGGPCQLCSAGEVCLGGANASSCPPNSNAPAGTADLADCTCNEQYVGPNGGVCLGCGIGQPNHFCPGGNTSYSCPVHSSAPLFASAVTDCLCDASYVGTAGGECQPCREGHYCPGNSADAVEVQCPENSSSVALSDDFSDCRCLPGFVGASADACMLCPPNYFCTGDQEIEPCDAANEADPKSQTLGRFGGGSRAKDCKCIPGYYGNDGAVCLPCAPDNFCVGGPVQKVCTANSQAPALSELESDCQCNAGFYYVPSNNLSESNGYSFSCEPCPANHYCIGNNNSFAPFPCYNHTQSPARSDERNDCLCVPEWYSSEVGLPCKQCEEGYYCAGGTSRQSCPENTIAAAGSTGKDACQCVA